MVGIVLLYNQRNHNKKKKLSSPQGLIMKTEEVNVFVIVLHCFLILKTEFLLSLERTRSLKISASLRFNFILLSALQQSQAKWFIAKEPLSPSLSK